MISKEQIQVITEQIVAAVQPERVYLFGSYASGKQHTESDLDFLVVMPDRKLNKLEVAKSIERKMQMDVAVSKDLIIEYADQFQRFHQISYSFIGHIVQTGVLLYES